MSLPPSPAPHGELERPRSSRARRTAALAAKRVLPPLLGLVLLAVLVYSQAGPGLPGVPRIGARQSPTAVVALIRAEEAPPEPGAAPIGEARPATDGIAPTPLATPRPVAIPEGPQLRVPLQSIAVADPGLASDAPSVGLIRNLFEGLLVADQDGALIPAGAERYQVSPDGLVYTFVLNRNARWSDGKPVTARDYEFAWKRNVDPRTQSVYAPALFPLENAEQINRQGASPATLGVRALDDYTLEATLERPTTYFPWLVATWTYYPLREDQLQQFGKLWVLPGRMISNGPFTLESSGDQLELLLVRNAHYSGEHPQLAAIVYRAYSSAEEMFAAYTKGTLDVMPVYAEMLPTIQKDTELQTQLHTFTLSNTSFLVLNTRRPAVKDWRVRQALGMALDRKVLLDSVLQQPGEPASSVHPPGIEGRDPSVWPVQDVQRAKQLMSEAGYPDGKGLPAIVYAAFSEHDPLLPYLSKRWQETLGVTLEAVLVPDPNDRYRHRQQWEEQVDVYFSGWSSDYADPSNWFNLLWDSSNDRGQFNTGWQNAKFDELVHQAQAEQDDRARAAHYHAAEVELARGCPVIPLFHQAQRYLVKPNVSGFGPGTTGVAPPLARVRIAS